jgi:hypothetical protein
MPTATEGVRRTCSSVTPAIVLRPRVITYSNPSPKYRFLDTSSGTHPAKPTVCDR